MISYSSTFSHLRQSHEINEMIIIQMVMVIIHNLASQFSFILIQMSRSFLPGEIASLPAKAPGNIPWTASTGNSSVGTPWKLVGAKTGGEFFQQKFQQDQDLGFYVSEAIFGDPPKHSP